MNTEKMSRVGVEVRAMRFIRDVGIKNLAVWDGALYLPSEILVTYQDIRLSQDVTNTVAVRVMSWLVLNGYAELYRKDAWRKNASKHYFRLTLKAERYIVELMKGIM